MAQQASSACAQTCGKCGRPAQWLNWLNPHWAVCNPCQASYLGNTIKSVQHRPTMKQVQTAVNEIMQYIRQENAALRDRVAHLESRVALLESQNSISPAKPASKADTIRNMLAAEPDLTAVEIQRRTGIKGGTIRDIMSQVRRSQPS